MAPVVTTLAGNPAIESQVCVTGQHREMLDQMLDLYGITPEFDLNLMKSGNDLTDLTTAVLLGMRDVLRVWRPDCLLVHGDTSTALASTLAAYYEKIPVGHVEAGLRSGNIYAPWPEEMNRRMVSAIAEVHFAPTAIAKANLLREGIDEQRIQVTGNTVIDALLAAVRRLRTDVTLQNAMQQRFQFLDSRRRLILVTGHRRENFGTGFENICAALNQISQRHDVEIVYPLHLNPQVQEPVRRLLGNNKRIHLTESLDYLPFIWLMDHAALLLTDSGGVQEEAPSLGKPVLVMRDTTERPEALAAGTVKLVGTCQQTIVRETYRLLDDVAEYERMSQAHNPYGDGQAATRIVNYLTSKK